MRRIFHLNCLALPILLFCVMPTSDFKSTVFSDKTSTSAVRITSKQIKSSSDTLNVDLKIPVLSGAKNKEFEKSLNEKFAKEVLSFKEGIEKSSADFQKYAKEHNIPLRPFDANVNYNVSYNKNNLLSITFYYYSFTGGAHGGTNALSYTIDLKNGKFLNLSDFFKTGINYKEKINAEIIRQMKTDGKFYFPDTFKSISDTPNFYIEDNNIVIYFQQYEIAPYAVGIPEFKIPFSLFQEELNPNINLN